MPDLTGLPAVDVAIGLSFIYLVLSLLASALQEAIAGVLALRAATLERGVRNMLEKDTGELLPGATNEDVAEAEGVENGPARNLADELYANPLITALYRKRWLLKRPRKPSYISPRSFALALVNTVAPTAQAPTGGTVPGSQDVVANVRSQLERMNIPAAVRHRLLAILDDARGDIDAFRTGLEAWFDDSMARVSGWYKRKAQLILAAIALIAILALNANSLTIGERLWKDPVIRAAVVQQATGSDVSPQTPGANAKARLKLAAENVDRVAKLGVPLGWSNNAHDPRYVNLDTAGDWIRNLAGWALTFVAVLIGAPFWFDTLSRLSRLRNSGKPETPLPASGRGQPNERVLTQSPSVQVAVHPPPSPEADRGRGPPPAAQAD